MAYITPADLAERPGAREIAQVASLPHQMVRSDALMDATLRGSDRSAWTAEEVQAADVVLARVQDAIGEASALIDGYLGQRGYKLPLALPPATSGQNVLMVWSRAITRYLLNKDRSLDVSKDPIGRDYQDALRMLGLVAQGKFSLGADDPEGASQKTSTDVRFAGDEPVFGRRQLQAFR